ncbi:hypothetical protein LXL04_038849 [Taraxacum kok-saghyz]
MDYDVSTPAQFLRDRERQVVHLICLLTAILTQRILANANRPKLPSRKLIRKRRRIREELLDDLQNGGHCRDQIRMSEHAFKKLCIILQHDGGLRPTQRMSVVEQVARFLHIVGNDFRNRFVSSLYRRSKFTTSRCFHRVLCAVIALETHFIQQPKGDVVPKEIQEKKIFYPFFKNCVGAIDGTHVRVKVPNKDAPRYRGRKGYPTINVLAACTFDLKFTYILTGWEGTASDSRILRSALTREDKLVIPTGRYYLVDAGLPHSTTIMTPYRGVRYHLKEYSSRAPENAKELFNIRHASLRNAIERAFGVLKRRFPIIRSTQEPFYDCKTQSDIFLACCILHNFLLEEDRDKKIEDEVLRELLNEPIEEVRHNSRDTHEGSAAAEQLRTSIANQMWNWMDECFIQSLLTQQDKGNRINGTFTSQAYANMVEDLNAKTGLSLTKCHLKNRMKTLKNSFSQWYDMFRGTSLSGFGWNSETHLIEADDEVWANLINSKPEAISLKTKKVSYYNEMLALFARDRASGEHAETPKEKNARLNNTAGNKIETIEDVDELLERNNITLENHQTNDDDDDDIQSISPTSFSSHQNSSAKKYKNKRKKVEDEDEDEDKPSSFEKVIMSAVTDVASAMREGNKIFKNSHHRVYAGDEIYKELEPMNLEDDELEEALMFLSHNHIDARTLFNVPFKLRKSLLKKMITRAKNAT